jgi:DNA gyrase subunit A
VQLFFFIIYQCKDVFFLNDADEKTIEHNGKMLELGHLKITSRDTKGTKVRL